MRLSFKKSCHLATFPFCLMEDYLVKDYGLHEGRDMLGTAAFQSLAHCRLSTNADG